MPQNNQIVQFYYGTQQEFDNISNKDNNIIYFTTDTKKIYVGNDLYTSSSNNLISVCTSTEYENMPARTSLIYLLLDGTNLTIKDANNNLLTIENASGSSDIPAVSFAPILLYKSFIQVLDANGIDFQTRINESQGGT